jgi:DNA-binding CsgD family transcriptional regulator
MLSRDELNKTILTLYREGREIALHRYKDWALERLREVVPFDAACWADSVVGSTQAYSIHRYQCDGFTPPIPANSFLSESLQHELVSQYGSLSIRSAISRQQSRKRTKLTSPSRVTNRDAFKLETLLINAAISRAELLTLWRPHGHPPFSEEERVMKQLLVPHLVQILGAVRLRHFMRGLDARSMVWALADNQGYIIDTSVAFTRCMREHLEHSNSLRLPDVLSELMKESGAYESRALSIDITRNENLNFLRVRPQTLLSNLTRREREVISLYASGETHAQISKKLSLSPTTVRNHISNCYRKLGVQSKGELANLLTRKEAPH